jgi:predicted transcriptional regulator
VSRAPGPGFGRRESGVLEREVLAAVASAGRALTPAEVQTALPKNLAYTTVMTTLTRLRDKGALSRERVGRAYAYAVIDPTSGAAGATAAVTAHHMRRLLDRDEDRQGVLARFVAELDPEDGKLLATLLPGADAMDSTALAGDGA